MKNYLVILIMIFIISCNDNKKDKIGIGEFPIKKNIDNLKQTDFVGTLENSFIENKNYIYSPTLVFAWNEIQKKLTDIHIIDNTNSRDLNLLNETKSNLNSLDKNEYTTEIDIKDGKIIAKSEFKLQLTFNPFLEKIDSSINFKNEEVEGFGMTDWDENKAKQAEIIYFVDNENFIFKLTPKEADNELIFIKGLDIESDNSFKEIIENYNLKQKLGVVEKQNDKLKWKYILKSGETFRIPELSFNIEKSYKNLIGQKFNSRSIEYVISIAKQRNALLLNNKGAKIESEAEIRTKSAKIVLEKTEKIIKHLILNNTFCIIIKHKDRVNPYFCAKIDNTELMNKKSY
ncbi:hypothetical protein GCM10022217_02400 [Chryseobacterium ginsenosidimutans]|uniref:hypothetical protein n=1 Tax=Chryseobacterium ginsenosidimutans TaxID=687846 RepID=UPI0031D59C86